MISSTHGDILSVIAPGAKVASQGAYVVNVIRRMCEECMVVFLEASLETRARRKELGREDYLAMTAPKIEHEVQEIRKIADVIIRNEDSIEELRQALRSVFVSR
jgi:dephospho-CoA kinase